MNGVLFCLLEHFGSRCCLGGSRGCSGPFSPWDAPEIRIRTRKIKKPAFIALVVEDEMVVVAE